jgi:hypothetical protein
MVLNDAQQGLDVFPNGDHLWLLGSWIKEQSFLTALGTAELGKRDKRTKYECQTPAVMVRPIRRIIPTPRDKGDRHSNRQTFAHRPVWFRVGAKCRNLSGLRTT